VKRFKQCSVRPEHSAFVHSDGHCSADVAAVERLAARAGVEGSWKDLDANAFVDDNGWVQFGFSAAHRLATGMAKREPDTVTMDVEAREEEACGLPATRWASAGNTNGCVTNARLLRLCGSGRASATISTASKGD